MSIAAIAPEALCGKNDRVVISLALWPEPVHDST
jgi:hypothetical protein